MLHQKQVFWKNLYPSYPLKKPSLILDLSLLPILTPTLSPISTHTQIPTSTLLKQLTQILTDISGIKSYIDSIIVPLSSFTQTLQKPHLNGLNKMQGKHCIFDYLVDKYIGELEVGVDIPVEELERFPKEWLTEGQLEKVRVFSVRVHIKQISKLVELKKIKYKFGAQVFHLNVTLVVPEDLIEIQRFLVQNEFPIESIILTTNLIEIIQLPQFGNPKINLSLSNGSPHNIAYHHSLYLQRYLTDTFINILQYHPIPLQLVPTLKSPETSNWKDIDHVMKILLQVQKEKGKQKDYQGGFVVSPNLFVTGLKNFFGGFENDLTLSGELVRCGIIGYREVMAGTFKSLNPESGV